MSKWAYERVSEAFDALKSFDNEEERQEVHREALDLYEAAGWTEDEFLDESWRRLEVMTAAADMLAELAGE
jgi:hypothetical protein